MEGIWFWKGKKRIGIIALSAGLLLGAAGCGKSEGEKEDPVKEIGCLLSINDTEFSEEQARLLLCNYRNIFGKSYDLDLCDAAGDDFEEYIKDMTVNEAARIISMDYLAAERGFTLEEEEQENVKAAAEKYYNSLNETELEWTGVTQEEIEVLYAQYALADKLYSSLAGSVNEEVSEDEARVLQIQMIYVTEKEKERQLEKELEDGGDFVTLAAQYNEAPAIEMTIKRGMLPEEVEKAVYRLNTEEVTEPVETDSGWYFVRCVDKNLKDLTEANKETIRKERQKEAFDDVYDAYVQSLSSVLNQAAYEMLECPDNEGIETNSFFEVLEEYYGA